MDLSKLLSPPDSRPRDISSPSLHDEISIGSMPEVYYTPKKSYKMHSDPQYKEATGRLPSPPVTPATQARQVTDNVSQDDERNGAMGEDGIVRDPVLFPHDNATTIASSEPLFPPVSLPQEEKIDPQIDRLVKDHMAMYRHLFRPDFQKPTREEYLLALSCVPIVSRRYSQNPRVWYQQEQKLLFERFGGANRAWRVPGHRNLVPLAPAPVNGIRKQPTTSRTPRAPRTTRTPKRTPQSKVIHSFDGVNSASPKRAIGTSREDTDFEALPDYAPPTSTLPSNNPKSLKADWRGQMLDLSSDPHRHLLHEAEVNLAATLRLSCATYLCSKRRIFMGRLDAMRIGKEFRKTDSQQACKIDVNKASKLWTAFEKVGWFKPEHFRQYL